MGIRVTSSFKLLWMILEECSNQIHGFRCLRESWFLVGGHPGLEWLVAFLKSWCQAVISRDWTHLYSLAMDGSSCRSTSLLTLGMASVLNFDESGGRMVVPHGGQTLLFLMLNYNDTFFMFIGHSNLWSVCSRPLLIFLLECLSFSYCFVGVFYSGYSPLVGYICDELLCLSCFGILWGFFLKFLFIKRGEGREEERKRNINVWLPLVRPLLGTWPATQACALTGNQTGNPLVCRLVLNPLSHTSQDCFSILNGVFWWTKVLEIFLRKLELSFSLFNF